MTILAQWMKTVQVFRPLMMGWLVCTAINCVAGLVLLQHHIFSPSKVLVMFFILTLFASVVVQQALLVRICLRILAQNPDIEQKISLDDNVIPTMQSLWEKLALIGVFVELSILACRAMQVKLQDRPAATYFVCIYTGLIVLTTLKVFDPNHKLYINCKSMILAMLHILRHLLIRVIEY